MIPAVQFEGAGPVIHFLHANGYPPESYRSFLSQFSPTYHVIASYLRPMWPGSDPDEVKDWTLFQDDLLQALRNPGQLGVDPGQLESRDGKIIGMGHSIGGTVTLMAALEKPEWFRALVLIEPVIFPPGLGLAFRLLNMVGLMKYLHPLMRRTLKRRRVFKSEGAMFENYREKGVFRRIPDCVLQDYVEGISRPRPDGNVELAYPPSWEAKIYETGGLVDPVIWRTLHDLEMPVLLIRGEETDTLRMRAVRMMSRLLPDMRIVNMPRTGHLIPLEAPGRVYEQVCSFLEA